MQRIYMQKNDVAITVQNHSGSQVIVGFERYPLMTTLGSVSPNEARTFAAMLIEQANECDRIAKESAHLADIQAISMMEATA